MDNYKRLLVGLDLSSLDKSVIKYTEFLAKKVKAKKIYFFHIVKDLHPNSWKFLANGKTLDEKLLAKVQERVEQNFADLDRFEVSYRVVEGSPAKQLIHWAELKQVDLMILGLKPFNRNKGIIPRQVARNATCSIMLVPENSPMKCSKIVVPIDFSEYSKGAFKMGLSIAQSESSGTLFPYHLYNLTAFSALEMTYVTPEPMVKSAAVKSYNDFIDEFELEGPHFQMNTESSGAVQAIEFAWTKKADMIVVGSQGKSGLKRLFLGSFAENMILEDQSIPLLIWKDTDNYRSNFNMSAEEFNDYMYTGRH